MLVCARARVTNGRHPQLGGTCIENAIFSMNRSFTGPSGRTTSRDPDERPLIGHDRPAHVLPDHRMVLFLQTLTPPCRHGACVVRLAPSLPTRGMGCLTRPPPCRHGACVVRLVSSLPTRGMGCLPRPLLADTGHVLLNSPLPCRHGECVVQLPPPCRHGVCVVQLVPFLPTQGTCRFARSLCCRHGHVSFDSPTAFRVRKYG
jgi:hypothetical protein